MALLFDGSDDSLVSTTVPITAYPFSMGCWWFPGNNTALNVLMGLFDTATNTLYQFMGGAGATAGDPIMAATANVAESSAVTTTGYSLSTWHHCLGVFTSATDRAAFIDGGSKGTNATSRAFSSAIDKVAIGRYMGLTPGSPANGRIAECAIWDVALTDAEAAVLAKGFSPLFVRPQNLVFYRPLQTLTEAERIAGLALTPTGTTEADHPRIFMPTSPRYGIAAGGLPPLNTVAPVVSGNLTVASTLSVTDGTWI